MTVGKPELQTTVMNSVTIDAFLRKWETDASLGASTIKSITVGLSKNVDTILTVDETLNGKAVTVQRGISTTTEQYVFRGEVINVVPDGGFLNVIIADKLYETTKRTVTKSFDKDIDTEAGKISEIFKTLINDHTTLTASAASIQDSGTTFIVNKFVMRADTVFDGLERLAAILGWQFFYDPDDDLVHFEPKGFTSQGTTFETGVNIVQVPKWEFDADELYNVIEVRGSLQEVETTEDGQIGTTTGYTTADILLLNKPVSVKLFLDASTPATVLKVGGITGSTGTFDYTVDAENKKVVANGTFTDTHYAQIRYSYMLPVPVLLTDDVSVDAFGTKKKVIHREDILEVDDAETFGSQYLTDHKDPIKKVNQLFVTNVSDAEIGQAVPIIDNFTGVTGNFIITRIKKSYPYRADEMTIVSNIFEDDNFDIDIQARLKRLEERNASEDDLLLHVLSSGSSITMENRYKSLEKRDITGTDTLVWGHFTFGIWNTGDWGADASLGTFSVQQMIQGKNIYKEFVYDVDFEDGTGTATWNTGSNKISFTSGQIALTDAISKGTTHTFFTVALAAVTGTITTEISGDGKSNWETVTLNTRTSFANASVAGVFLRFTEAAATTAELNNTTKSDNSFNEPAIKVTLEQ